MKLGRTLLTLAVLAYALAAGANGFDRLSGDVVTAERLVPGPFRAAAHRSAAGIELGQQNFAAALTDARRAVASDPIDPDSSALLGTALLLTGDEEAAERAFRVAARFGWRNFATQAYWFDAALSVGDYEVAANRADALLRAHPQFAREAAFLQPFEESPAGRAVLAAHLQQRPPWLPGYLNMTRNADGTALDRRYAILQQAIASGTALTCEDISGMTRTLLANGRRRQAEALWNKSCPQSPVSAGIADLSFERALPPKNEGFPFAWQLRSSGDLSVRPAEGGDGLVLALETDGTRLVLSQPVALPPGRYRFRAVTGPDNARPQDRLLVSLACGPQPPFPRRPEGDLQREGQVLTVEECATQHLGIWLEGGERPVQLRSIAFDRLGS